jgi:pSer/pThr/pTyr-binding forkhead associated (FHA) protein
MEDPIAEALKFGFITVLYLFLLWVARSALKDLRRPAVPRGATRREAAGQSQPVLGQPVIVAEGGGGLRAGTSFAVDGSTTIGRSPATDIQIDDPFASSRHARIYEGDGSCYIEDMGSTNGTYVNGTRLNEREVLRAHDRIRIGDTEFRYEQR